MKVLLVSLCGTMLAVGLRGENVCCSCARAVTAEKGVRAASRMASAMASAASVPAMFRSALTGVPQLAA